MNEFPPEIPTDFKPRRGFLMASGIIFGLFGLMLCGFAVMSVFQYLMISSMGLMDPEATAEMEGVKEMTDMIRAGAIVNFVFYGLLGVTMILVGYGCLFLKRWSRPFALTLTWGWLYTGLIMVITIIFMMSGMQQLMTSTMEEAAATSGGTAPPLDGIIAVVMVFYAAFLFVFMMLVPGLLLWFNWGQDVRRTLEVSDPKPRWTDRQPVPVIGMCIGAAFLAVASLPGLLMMNQPWMSQFIPSDAIRYAFFLIPVGWGFVAWGSYRRQLAAWAVALVLLIAAVGMGIYSMQNVDWGQMYGQMGMPEADVEKMASLLNDMMQPRNMAVLMAVSMLPLIGFLIWVGRYFWGRPESGGGEGRLVASA